MKQTNDDSPVVIRDAATVVLLRDQPRKGLEVLLLRRHHGHAFGADADVFPGGAVDATDGELARRVYHGSRDLGDAAWRMAALRECFEEAGLLFAANAEVLDAKRVAGERAALNAGRRDWAEVISTLAIEPDLSAPVAFAHWTTPPGPPRRFATRFYVLPAPAGQVAQPDGQEMVTAEWVAPATALAEAAENRRLLMRPTRATLEQLAGYRDTASALAGLAQGEYDA